MTEIILIRHGETEWNISGRWQGHADSALSARGIARERHWPKEWEWKLWILFMLVILSVLSTPHVLQVALRTGDFPL